MNCALIDDDDVAVVGCAVDGDGIMSEGMHEKRGKKTRTAEREHDAALWLMMEVSRRGKRRTDGTIILVSPKDQNSAKASLL